jgi:2'-5' RNA ligase
MIRSFIAIDIPESIRQQLDDLVTKLRQNQADVKWVKSKSIHLTLKFLGNVEEDRIPKIINIIQNVVEDFKPFTISIEGTGTFPNDRRPRVLWIGVQKGSKTLVPLVSDLNSKLTALGFEREKRSYSPHLTLGRVRSPKGIDIVVDKLHSTAFQESDFLCEDILLMKSDLRPEGAVHTVLEKIKL